MHLFGCNLLSFNKFIIDELKVVTKELQLPMLYTLNDIKRETQNRVIGVFSSVHGDETSHITDETYSLFTAISFISEGLDAVCKNSCNLLKLMRVFI